MPIYRARCDVCGAEQDVFRSVANYDDLPHCCGQKMGRRIMPAMVAADIQPYRSMITGEMITSRSKHRTHLRDHGCIEIGNEKIPPPKPIDLTPESHKRRKELIIRKVKEANHTA
jgi:hypothetical protein